MEQQKDLEQRLNDIVDSVETEEEFQIVMDYLESLDEDEDEDEKTTKSGGNKKYVTKAKAKQKRKLQKQARKSNR